MSKLNFASVTEAYSIGSEQIKNTQSEIARLKKIIEDSSKNQSDTLTVIPEQKEKGVNNEYKRIGNPDTTQATFCKPMNNNTGYVLSKPEYLQNEIPLDDFDYTFLRIMRHPRFDEIVKNYVIINHPDWILNNTHYVPNNPNNPNQIIYSRSKEMFGSENVTKNYVIFFIVAIMIYLGICLVYKDK